MTGTAVSPSTPALQLAQLHAWYGDSHVLHGVDLEVQRGELVSLLGRNGSGRSTTLKSIVRLVDRTEGSIRIHGVAVERAAAHQVARQGVGYCPEERGIFTALTTRENLDLLPRLGHGGMAIEQIYTMFPNLRERAASMAGKLSGGEQQMLAMARILRTGASILLLDEITEGLAPVIVDRLADVTRALKELGYTILMVEQNLQFVQDIADRHYVMESGRIVDTVSNAELASKRATIDRLLSV
ncbi:ABC transporter ATP-binding protein [Lampropedia aestuarii]|uniref:ABC transporter ATP-binding protein n=1 Tax=Lampropedia aestuarii TaxID=2562762 RepID=UPI0024691FD8|nr:ABC transporter ATP-binding protein [Lampropedia aestuarii]MDH5856473.1 ABC transporter ATP-binding protein [Lampropedia aestuarii]